MNNRRTILHLSLIEGVGPATIAALHEGTQGNLAQLYSWSAADIARVISWNRERAQLIVDGLSDHTGLEKEIARIESNALSWYTLYDPLYPELLKQSHLPPAVLYVQGALPAPEQALLAMVGSRDANSYGHQVVNHLVPELVAHNWVIVSGGARGIDTMVHHATVQSGGATVVVLGTGVLEWYPASNKKLFGQVLDTGGAIISPFPTTMPAIPENFPARNRVIAGMSRGCVVVQAAAKSGARITATFALEQGKEVFAVPGPISDELSAGCHALIQEGAQLVHSVQDILQVFGQQMPCVSGKSETQQQELPFAVPVNLENLPIAEQIIYLCAQPQSFDDLLEKTRVEYNPLQALLVDLQMEGKLEQHFTGKWVRV